MGSGRYAALITEHQMLDPRITDHADGGFSMITCALAPTVPRVCVGRAIRSISAPGLGGSSQADGVKLRSQTLSTMGGTLCSACQPYH